MTNVIDINNASRQTDINDANRQTDVNNTESMNVNDIVNRQMDVKNINEHISTCIDKITHKVCIYFKIQ